MSSLHRVAIIATALVALAARAPAQLPDASMAGDWSGDAAMPEWVAQRTLPVRITIGADGSVTGSVGDAQLSGARLSLNRGVVETALGTGREFLIAGRLGGPIVSGEAQQRARVRITLDWRNGSFTGELETSGSDGGSVKERRITGGSLVLRRARTGMQPSTSPGGFRLSRYHS